jgi:hypothetical protein
VQQRVEFLERARVDPIAFRRAHPWSVNRERLRKIVMGWSAFFHSWREVSVHPQDVVRDHAVPRFVYIICDNEQ